MIKIFACFLLGCVVLTFGARRERIAYGRDVTELEFKEEFPFMVYVRVCLWYSFSTKCNFCSGTLVTPDRVIVAAHCYCGRGDYPTTTVYSSTLNRGRRKGTGTAAGRITSGMPKTYCGKSVKSHIDKDIALIGLIQNLDVPTVPLFCEEIPIPVGTKVWMIGFGNNEKKVKGILRVAATITVECPEDKSQHIFCAKTFYKEPTILGGDSGGPLLIKRGGRFIQIGVASMGNKLIKSPGYLVYNAWANVSPFCKAISNASK